MDPSHRPEECKELFARLSEYLDGELDDAERKEIEAHLCDCPPCIEFLESLRRSIELCRHFDPPASSEDFDPSVKQRLLSALQQSLANRGNPR